MYLMAAGIIFIY